MSSSASEDEKAPLLPPSSAPTSAEAETTQQQQQQQPQRQQQAAHVPHEPYPLKRVLISCFLLVLCWTIGYYREYKDTADANLKQIQDWGFNKVWIRFSSTLYKRIEPYRQELWPQIRGNVLEIGPGYGEALGMLRRAKQGGLVDAKAITRYVALEPNAYLHSQLTINAQSNGFLVQYDVNTCPNATAFNEHARSLVADVKGDPVLTIVNGTLDNPLAVPRFLRDNAPYDYIVSSMVLCSVDDVEANLRAIFDLLAPGGRFVFIEHVHHTDSSDPTVVPGAKGTVTKPFDVAMWRRVQDVLSPVWRIFSGNCHLNREPARVLHDMGAGWSAIEYKTIRGSGGFMEKLAPLIYGVATKEL